MSLIYGLADWRVNRLVNAIKLGVVVNRWRDRRVRRWISVFIALNKSAEALIRLLGHISTKRNWYNP
jgi:hypothetical protein